MWTRQDQQKLFKVYERDRNSSIPKGFLVWSQQCKIISLDPHSNDVLEHFSKQDFEPCSTKQPLTSIEQSFDDNKVWIIVNEEEKSNYLWFYHFHLICCYQEINRGGAGENADDEFNLSECQYFETSIKIPPYVEFILVRCKGRLTKNNFTGQTIYTNAHAIVQRKPEITKSSKSLNSKERPLSVLMLGIDSVSRLNLLRSMPITAQHLYDNDWFELQGYTKIADNTFPNLMAILAGFNETEIYQTCDPGVSGKLDNCSIIWREFSDRGYATAYAEDEAAIGTFNYLKSGFIKQPTTHYLRPFTLAIEKYLSTQFKSWLKFCIGYQNYVDFIYQYAIDFATAYENHQFFGLFWTNTFTHNDISDPSSMDERMKYYLEELEFKGVLKNSAVIFFSDHGLRFGPVREKLLTGWLEERLPFMFIWLPEWFRKAHPEFALSLRKNRNRLTSPYDIHMTLKHILDLPERKENFSSAASCPKCQSLFRDVPLNRSCSDAGINAHWCVCSDYKKVDAQDEIGADSVEFVIDWINKELTEKTRSSDGTEPCFSLYLKKIILIMKSESTNFTDYVVKFDVLPSNARFESTVRHFLTGEQNSKEIVGGISRLNEYGWQANCVNELRMFCFCRKNFLNFISSFINKII